MSNTQFIFINQKNVPAQKDLQSSIDSLGFDFQIDPDFKPIEDEGFSPCTLNGDSEVGFEMFFEPASDIIEDDEQLNAIAKNMDYCISLCWGGSMKDCACVMIISCALAKDFEAIVSYEGEESESLEKLLSDTKAIINDLDSPTIQVVKEITDKKEIEKLLIEELNLIVGEAVNINADYYQKRSDVTVVTPTRYRFSASIFKFITNKQIIDVSGYGEMNSKKTSLLYKLNDEPTKEQLTELESLLDQIDVALEKDEKAIVKMQAELKSKPNQTIKEIKWLGNGYLKLYCSNFIIGLFSIDEFSLGDIVFTTPKYQFKISQSNISIKIL